MGYTYAQPAIRAQLSITSNPPVAPIDIETGLAPQFWRGAGIRIDVGIFDSLDVGLDLSNLVTLVLRVQPDQLSPAPWIEKTVNAGGITGSIAYGSWLEGLAQNASFILDASDTDVGLAGLGERPFWMSVTGYSEEDGILVYGAGWITIYNPGNTVPNPAAAGVVGFGTLTTAVGNQALNPRSQVDTWEVTLGAAAGVHNVVVGTVGLVPGAHLTLPIGIPPTAGIVVNFLSGSISGPLIQSFTTTGGGLVDEALLTCYYSGSSHAWEALYYQGPIP